MKGWWNSFKYGESFQKFWLRAFMGVAVTLFGMVAVASAKLPWSTRLNPGDKVCIYDISEEDPLVDGGNDSLKYWDNSSSGDKKARRVLRASVRRLVFRVLEPGLVVNGTPDKYGRYWYSGSLVAVQGGYKPNTDKMYTITRGKNVLLGQSGRSWVKDWSVVHFVKARFTKKPLVGGCKRKYAHY